MGLFWGFYGSLLNNIAPYGLQLKKKAQIETVSEDFSVKWTNVLYDAERKLVQLLLNESQLMYDKTDKELNNPIKSGYPENSLDIKNEIIDQNSTLKIALNERRVKKWRKFKRKKRLIKSPKRSSKVSDFVELALKRSQFQYVTDNRKYIKNVTNDQAENKKEILNNNTDTISIVGRTELEDGRVYSHENSDTEKSIVNVGMTGKLISSGNISSSEVIIMSADNINACRTEGHGYIDHGIDENHLGEEIISNNKQSFNSREKRSKNNVSLSQRDTSLVDILASLLKGENTVQALSPSVITSTTGNVSIHGNST